MECVYLLMGVFTQLRSRGLKVASSHQTASSCYVLKNETYIKHDISDLDFKDCAGVLGTRAG